MGKLSILSLTLLFSMLFILAKGSRVELDNFESNSLRSDSPSQVFNWYVDLPKKQLITGITYVYLHATNKVNQIQVAHSLVPGSTPSFFGDIYAFDYLVKYTPAVSSMNLGTAQGFFVENSQEQFAALLGINLSFKESPNSILQLQGQDKFNDEYRELAIIGGTGAFRLATGSAIMHNVFREKDKAIIELTLFVRYYKAAAATTWSNSLRSRSDIYRQVSNWYDDLPKKQLITRVTQVYLHATNKVNQIQVAHSLVPGSTPSFFGDIYAFDYIAKASPSVTSVIMGAAQGFFVENSQEQFAALLGINLFLTEFPNSSLQIQGQDKFNDEYRELAIIGGTGELRLATGTAIMYNEFREKDKAIIELTLYARYYRAAARAA